jgi:ADP-ribosylglycohydrolase
VSQKAKDKQKKLDKAVPMLGSAQISRRALLVGALAGVQALEGAAQDRLPLRHTLHARSVIATADYIERVYAGVLGKLIGVFLGRPVEGWDYDQIVGELGEVNYYVNERLNVPLVVTDDDISGTFGFLRALPDYGYRHDLSAAQIGQTWLNYVIEKQTTLWWGGMGNSTAHTAYLRLKSGIEAPASGSIARNGKVVAEQIEAQIFVDGWAMLAPGDPQFAADLARRASSVSHDGEAIYAAQVLAAMEAQAFVEPDINALIDTAVRLIPPDSNIRRMIDDVRNWRAAEPDWRNTRRRIEENYGPSEFPGAIHVVPNQALIFLALLYGDGDFGRSLTIVNTSGEDTDCNSGNVGCLLGIRGGLTGLDNGRDWRGPINDRMLLSTADGGRSVTDAVNETYAIVNAARALREEPPLKPKRGARFHFELPGATQGFRVEPGLRLENVAHHSRAGTRSLALRYRRAGRSLTATTPTFEATDNAADRYALSQSPTLYTGQTLSVGLEADAGNATPVTCQVIARSFSPDDVPVNLYGTRKVLRPGEVATLDWRVADTHGAPITDIGVSVIAGAAATVYLDSLGWDGAPDIRLSRSAGSGTQWRRAWVKAVDHWHNSSLESFRLSQDEGRGLLIQGTREWANYAVSVDLNAHMAKAAGLAARVQGLRRYYALLLRRDATAALIKVLDGERELAHVPFDWQGGQTYRLRLSVDGPHVRAFVDDQMLFDLEDTDSPLLSGAIALVCDEGTLAADVVTVSPRQGTRLT